jgi:7TMR-DISM extracellular 2
MLAVCAAIAFNCHAGELVTSREFLVDNSSNKTLAEVSSETLTPFSGILNRGFTKAAIWIRLEITPPQEAEPNEDIILRIRPVFLDEIRLFDPLDESGLVRITGDTTPLQTAEYPSLSHTFVIPAGHAPRPIWLRLKTTSTSLINVEAITRKEMIDSELNLNLIYFTLLTILAMFVLFILINWTNHREFLYTLFVTRQVLFLTYTASLFGLHRYLLKIVPANALDYLFSWIVIGVTAASFIFERTFLKEYSPNKWGRIALNSLLVWSGVVVLLMTFGATQEALKFNMILNALGIVVLLVVALLTIEKKIHRSLLMLHY